MAMHVNSELLCFNQKLFFSLAEQIDFSQKTGLAAKLARYETFLLERTQHATQGVLESIQARKLQRVLISAAQTPYWQKRCDVFSAPFARMSSLQELGSIPALTRETLKRHPPQEFINPTLSANRLYKTSTSGSTGEPLGLWLDTAVIPGRIARFKRMLRWLGTENTPFVRMLPRVPMGFTGFPFFPMKNCPFDEKLVDSIMKFIAGLGTPVVIDTFPSHIAMLARFSKGRSAAKDLIAGFVTGGEHAQPDMRQLVRDVFDCPVLPYYGSTEFEVIAQACRDSETTMHVNAEYFYLEILDESNNPVHAGVRGKVILTSLEHQVHPFIRYEIGDYGKLVPGQCPCGSTLPRIVLEGRTSQLITLVNGTALSYFDFRRPIVSEKNIWGFQIIHETPERILVKFVPAPDGISPRDIARMRRGLEVLLGAGMSVSLEMVKTIEPAKSGKRMEYIKKWQ